MSSYYEVNPAKIQVFIDEWVTRGNTDYYLTISKMSLKKFPILPEGIKRLNLRCNRISEIPSDLPSTLEWLVLDRNRITKIPDSLPEGLKMLYIHNNRIDEFPKKFPSTLIHCSMDKNPITIGTVLEGYSDIRYDVYMKILKEKMEERIEEESKKRQQTRTLLLFEEIVMNVWHPSRVEALLEAGIDLESL
jgi:Leucine-rich repeat (LRR) protein